MDKRVVISLFFLLFLNNTYSFMINYDSYCTNQGYNLISEKNATYDYGHYKNVSVKIISYDYHNQYILYNGTEYPFIINKTFVSNIFYPQFLTQEDVPFQRYCVFDENNRCEFTEFYENKCGEEFQKEIKCVKKGESVYSFEMCCGTLEKFSPPNIKGGNIICREPLGFLLAFLKK